MSVDTTTIKDTTVKDAKVESTALATTASYTPKDRRGLSICVISRGQIPTVWMKHMVEKVSKMIPSGTYWNWVFAIGTPETNGKNYATLRNECVAEAMRRGSKWVLFVDDDVFIPDFSIQRFMTLAQKGYKVISGIYYKKSEQVEPVIFKRLGDGPYYDFPTNEVFEIEGSGAGCMWIDLDIFKKFDEAKLPYFKQDWIMSLDKKNKNLVQVEIGEDHWLYYQAKQLGFPSYCDSSLMCDHFDIRTDKMYPLEEEVARVRGLDFRNKKIWSERIKRFEEMNKPHVMFVAPTSLPFTGDSIKEKPIGGSETALIQTAKGLAKDYNVSVFCNCPRPEVYDGVLYVDISMMDLMHDVPIDTMILFRINNAEYVSGMKNKFKSKKTIFWTQDYPMYPGFNPDFPQIAEVVDKLICVSNDHKEMLLQRFPLLIDESKVIVIENGVDNELYKDKDNIKKKKNQFYYSSTPFRGLEVLVDLFPRIKKEVPDATLKVCSSMLVYGDVSSEKIHEKLYEKCKNTKGIEYVGSLKQNELAKVAMESELMLYPSTFAETCCISVMESQTAGTPIVCNTLGALKETVHEGCGVKIKGNPKTKKWQDEFVNTVIGMCKKEPKAYDWDLMHKNCLKQNFDWSLSVIKWKKTLKELVGEQSTKVEKSWSNKAIV